MSVDAKKRGERSREVGQRKIDIVRDEITKDYKGLSKKYRQGSLFGDR